MNQATQTYQMTDIDNRVVISDSEASGSPMSAAGSAYGSPGQQGRGPSIYMEWYCGSCRAAMAAKIKHPGIIVICLDVRDKETLEITFKQYRLKEFFEDPQVFFIQMDMRLVAIRDIEAWCAEHYCNVFDIVGVHVSFPCDLSAYIANINRQNHRDSQDTAESIEAQWDDKARWAGYEVIRWIVRWAPKALITLENPWHSTWKKSDMVQQLLRWQQHQFWLIKEDLCATADNTYDRILKKNSLIKRIVPHKPTALVVHGIHVERYATRRCKKEACPMTFEGSKIHRVIVCSKSEKEKAKQAHNFKQENVPKDENCVLTIGLFLDLWDEHFEWLREYGEDYYCAICANNNVKENEVSEVKVCEICLRVQHPECSLDSSGEDWKCDTCYRRSRLGMSVKKAGLMDDDKISKLDLLISWMEKELITKEQYIKLRDELC